MNRFLLCLVTSAVRFGSTEEFHNEISTATREGRRDFSHLQCKNFSNKIIITPNVWKPGVRGEISSLSYLESRVKLRNSSEAIRRLEFAPYWLGIFTDSCNFLFQEDYRRAFDEMEIELGKLNQKFKKKRSKFNCTLVHHTIWLDPLGNTFICAMFRDLPRRNILKDPMAKIYESHLKVVKSYEVRPAECLSCEQLKECTHACVCGIRNARMISQREFDYVCNGLKSIIHLKRKLDKESLKTAATGGRSCLLKK